MKKIVSLVLVLVMCLSLSGFANSEGAKAVEERIASIEEESIDKADMIQEIIQAYEALSEEDKEKIDNLDILQKAMFTDIAEKCEEMNAGSDLVAQSVIVVWKNVGGEKFWTYYRNILIYQDESVANVDIYDTSFLNSMYWDLPAYALGIVEHTLTDIPIEVRQEIVDTCTILANTYFGIQDLSEQVSEEFIQYKELFGKEYDDECQFLRKWYLASSVFVEFATNPSGKLNDYTTKLSEHKSTAYAFQKEADLMK